MFSGCLREVLKINICLVTVYKYLIVKLSMLYINIFRYKALSIYSYKAC